MAVITRDSLLSKMKEIIGERNDDEALAFIEDVTNTVDDYEARVKDSTDWKAKYEENDKSWREKYKSAFFEGVPEKDDDSQDDEEETIKIKSFDELFKEG